MTPFRNEKNSNWEGAYRVPCLLRWPGHIPAGITVNDICRHLDMLPTILAAAGDRHQGEAAAPPPADGQDYSVHLDGYNLMPFLTEEGVRSPRQGFFYFSDDGDLTALRYDNWKVVFMEQRVPGQCRSGPSPSSPCACRSFQPAH